MSALWNELRAAARGFARNPGFAAVAVLCLALGIGANSAVFSVVHSLVLSSLPFGEPERLVAVQPEYRGPEPLAPGAWSYPLFRAFRDSGAPFDGVAAHVPLAFNLAAAGGGEARRVHAELVSASYLPVLGVEPVEGRGFRPEEDDAPGEHPVALLSHDLWRSAFGGRPLPLGGPIELDGVALDVVGVMPAGFRGVSGQAEVWVPMAMVPVFQSPRRLEIPFAFWHQVVARVPAGTSEEGLAAALELAADRMAEAFPAPSWLPGAEPALTAAPLEETRVGSTLRTRLLFLLGAMGLVLLVACANVANLLLSRGEARRADLALRMALGASRPRLARGLLVESLLLAVAGGVAGLAVARLGVSALVALRPRLPGGEWVSYATGTALGEVRIGGAVLAFNFLVAAASGLLFGLAPVLQARRGELRGSLLGLSPGAGRGGRVPASQLVLVTGQAALAVVLAAGAGLLAHSFARLATTDPGFDPSRTLTAQLELPKATYGDEEVPRFVGELLGRVEGLPGVEAATAAIATPLSGRGSAAGVRIDDEPEPEGMGRTVGFQAAAPGHFRVLGVPVLRGRGFREGDGAPDRMVAVVSRSAAQELWPDEPDPVGRRLRLSIGWEEGRWAEVVGVVGDVAYGEPPGDAGSLEPQVYVPYAQVPGQRSFFLLARTVGEPGIAAPAVRTVLRELDPGLPLFDVATLEERVGRALSQQRFSAFTMGLFAVIALVLAGIGVYGVMAFAVARRVRELGVRIALGAARRDVYRLVLARALGLAGLGVALGLLAALALGPLVRSQLHGVEPGDPLALAGAAALLLATAAAAALVPARRATRIDPVEAIRSE